MTKGDVEFDVPFRELGFHGVPHRETVLLQPTTNCLVHLTNWVGGIVVMLNALGISNQPGVLNFGPKSVVHIRYL